MAFIPRTLALDAFVAPDEGKWIYRSAHFLQAFLAGELDQMTSIAATPEVEVLAPAVSTMWTGALGLAAKYWLEGTSPSDSLSNYLQAIPGNTEKIPLDFYPWTRFPTVLLTSLTILIVYVLLAKLLGKWVALVATLLLALDPFFIGLSRVIHHDALVSIFVAISLLALLLYRRQNKARRWLILSGVTGGLALLTKPTALYLVLFVAIFLLWEATASPAPALTGSSTPTLLARLRSSILAGFIWGCLALVTFVACWPAMWIAPVHTLTDLVDRAANAVDGGNNYPLIPGPGSPLPELGFLFYPVNWLFKATLPILVGLVALVISWWRGWLTHYTLAGTDRETTNWTVKWLTRFVLLFLFLLIPADTRDIRYFLPAVPELYILAAVGALMLVTNLAAKKQAGGGQPTATRTGQKTSLIWPISLLLAIQLILAAVYFPYFVDYWNPVIGGVWLAPRLVKIGSGEGLDQMGRYLSRKSNAAELTVSTSFWESFVPFFSGHYTKPHYDDEADYLLIYRRQIQNRNPFPEYWTYFSARPPEHKVSLVGLDYAWLYPGPQLRVVRQADFGNGLILRGYRLKEPAAQPGQTAELTLVWAGVTPSLADALVTVDLIDEVGHIWVTLSGPILAPDAPSLVEGHYSLDIPAQLARGNYELRVTFEDVSHPVGTVPVRHLEQPSVRFPAAVNFGDLITLGGADINNTTVSPGQPVEIALVWQRRQPIWRSYTTFVHIVDKAGQIWAQADRLPGDGRWPTETWAKEEWIIDTFQIYLGPDIPDGTYLMLIGIYDSETVERLPIMEQNKNQTVVEIMPIVIHHND